MDTGTKLFLAALVIGGGGLTVYALSQKDSSSATELAAERLQNQQLQLQLQSAQLQSAQANQAAPQAQQAGNGVTKAVDGIIQLISLFG